MAVATATGTPINSASTEVISVPTRSGSAPKCSALTFQGWPNTKPNTPSFSNAGRASPTSSKKKKTISARIRAARKVSPYFSRRSGRRASGDREKVARSPLGIAAASNVSADCRSVALKPGRGFLGLGQDRRRQRRVVGLRENRLSFPESVLEELHDALGRGLAAWDASLAEVLVDHDECLRGDRVGAGCRRRSVLPARGRLVDE